MDPDAASSDSALAGDEGVIDVVHFDDQIDEAQAVAESVEVWLRNEVSLNEIAILVRQQPHDQPAGLRGARHAPLFVSVLFFVAARLDFVLRPATPVPHVEPGRIGKLLTRIGVSNLRGQVGEAAAVIMAALAIWAAVTGGEVAFPSVDPSLFSRTGVAER